MSRYARQIAVIGQPAQDRLRKARVLMVGAGGLAAPSLPYLVGAGLGAVRLVDADVVSLSNLHRQTLFTEADIGQPKVNIAAQRMKALNPECMVEPVQDALDPANAADLAAGCDVVLDCADSFAASYILSDTCQAAGVPLISASVVGLDGYVGGFCAGAPSLRALFPDLPARMESCDSAGVLGPLVGIIGALQAQMAVAVITGLKPSPLGQLTTYDAATMRCGGFRFDTAPEPAHRPTFIARTALCDDDLIIDLRAAHEGPLPRNTAHRIVPGQPLPQPEQGQRMVLCCRSGLRAWNAAETLADQTNKDIALLALGDETGEGNP